MTFDIHSLQFTYIGWPDAALLPVDFQLQFLLDPFENTRIGPFGTSLAPAVDRQIVCVADESHSTGLEFFVELVEVDVRQKRTQDASYTTLSFWPF